MTYLEWEREVPETLSGDPLWRVEAYRLALFLVDQAWKDVSRLVEDRRTVSLEDQLYRAAGLIAANIGEGYSRGSGRDRAKFYEYALGSARETRGWYHAARHILGEDVKTHRIDMTTQITRLLLTIIPQQRRIKEPLKS